MSELFIGEDDLENADSEREPECTCERVDVDLYDSRDCEAHGPDSQLAKRNRQAEADAEAAFWRDLNGLLFEHDIWLAWKGPWRLKNGVTSARLVRIAFGGLIFTVHIDGYKKARDYSSSFWEIAE